MNSKNEREQSIEDKEFEEELQILKKNKDDTEINLRKAQHQLKITQSLLQDDKTFYRSASVIFEPSKKSLSLPKADRQNNIKISDFDFVDINDDFVKKPKDRKFDDVCSICSGSIFFDKYVCCICSNCNLCKECEKEHLHPVFKCKNSKISTLTDIYNYLTENQMRQVKMEQINGGFFSPKYELKLYTISTVFAMRPNKKINLPLVIENLNVAVPKNVFLALISRNSKDLIIYNTQINKEIKKKEQVEINVPIESNSFCKDYHFKIELYSMNAKIESNAIHFDIQVNEDQEDEQINEFFGEYPKFLVLNKEQKKVIKVIMEKKVTKEHPYFIMSMLKSNNWDVERTINEMKGIKEKLN